MGYKTGTPPVVGRLTPLSKSDYKKSTNPDKKRMTTMNMEQQREVYEAAQAKRIHRQQRNLRNAGLPVFTQSEEL